MNKTKNLLLKLSPLLSLLFWLLLWLLLALSFRKPLLLPTPFAVFRALFSLLGTAAFWLQLSLSLGRVLSGIIAAFLGGALLSLLTARWRLAYHIFAPFLNTCKATPVASMIFLLLLWMGRDLVPFFITLLLALPIFWSNLHTGLISSDAQLLEMARCFKISKSRTFVKIRLPQLLPHIFAACRAAIGLAFKAGVAAEVLALPENSIGRAIYESKLYLLTDELFAYTLAVILLSSLIELAVLHLLPEKKKEVGDRADT